MLLSIHNIEGCGISVTVCFDEEGGFEKKKALVMLGDRSGNREEESVICPYG
jgi:hypothetical protein